MTLLQYPIKPDVLALFARFMKPIICPTALVAQLAIVQVHGDALQICKVVLHILAQGVAQEACNVPAIAHIVHGARPVDHLLMHAMVSAPNLTWYISVLGT